MTDVQGKPLGAVAALAAAAATTETSPPFKVDETVPPCAIPPAELGENADPPENRLPLQRGEDPRLADREAQRDITQADVRRFFADRGLKFEANLTLSCAGHSAEGQIDPVNGTGAFAVVEALMLKVAASPPDREAVQPSTATLPHEFEKTEGSGSIRCKHCNKPKWQAVEGELCAARPVPKET